MIRSARPAAAIAISALLTLLAPAAASAAAPTITATSFSEVAETAATLHAEVNPQSREVEDAHFQYITQADWEADGDSFGAGTQLTEAQTIPSGTAPVAIQATATGLQPGTAYRLRAYAKSRAGTTEGPEEATFTTLSGPQAFGPCPNDPFRSGIYAPLGQPSAALPDCRAYEQASPVEKDGGDAVGKLALAKAAPSGDAISFSSTFGIPGGEGAQELPTYVALRGPGESGWATQGLFPPESAGERAQVIGWTPEFSEIFSEPEKLEEPRTQGLVGQSSADRSLSVLGPYLPHAEYSYAGSSADGQTVVFESQAALGAEAVAGASNVYAWDRESGQVSLISRLNEAPETEAALAKGAFAGPYAWGSGINANALRIGGAARSYYLQDTHAVAGDGSTYFTAAATGQLYLRLNPTMPQSPLNGEGECTDKALACTIHVSASQKTNGVSLDGADPAGPQPAAFMAATADGAEAFFTSPEKLTNDANTGPEQPEAAIRRDTIEGAPENVEPHFLQKHGVGLAIDPADAHVYWADPATGTIGRAKIDGSDAEEGFIAPEPTECEVEVANHVFAPRSAPATPRYVAVDGEYVYWSNTGPLDRFERPAKGCGTIGRAKLNPVTGEAEEVEAECVSGAFNPQGVAVNATHIYWANAGTSVRGPQAIGRATIDCKEPNPVFIETKGGGVPFGVALDATYVYWADNEESGANDYLERAPLGGGEPKGLFTGKGGIRGVAIAGPDIYWAEQGAHRIGRMPVADFVGGSCALIPTCEEEFIAVEGDANGVAADASHILWAVNGEAPLNPGNDLYRFDAAAEAGHRLTDLTAQAGADGAEALGVLGASADGEYLYLAANGALAGGASPGDCKTAGAHGGFGSLSGECNLYLDHEGSLSFIARLGVAVGKAGALNWVPTPYELFNSSSYVPRSSFVGAGGRVLLFGAKERLSEYDNEGVPELYRYEAGNPKIACVSCDPDGAAPEGGPSLGSLEAKNRIVDVAAVPSRNLSASGNRAFFETKEALVGADTNEQTDVYEWEAPGEGSCTEAAAPYSPQDEGCLYLLSGGAGPYPSYLLDASASGDDVFFLTRQSLVAADTDNLKDVYDARAGGGLASQGPPPKGCEGEPCKPAATPAPSLASPATPSFKGPDNLKPKRRCPKGKVLRKGKKGKALRCVKRHHRKRHHHHHRHRKHGSRR